MTIAIRSDLPIKYYLNLHNDPRVFDSDTYLFEIIQYLLRVIDSKSKELSYDNLKFSSKSLKYIFGDKLNDETFKTNLVKTLKEMISENLLESQGDFIKITQLSISKFYKVND
jgi:hypothetical protein